METSIIIETIIKCIVILTIFSALAGFTTYVERKPITLMVEGLGTQGMA